MTKTPPPVLPFGLASGLVIDLTRPCLDGLDWRIDVARSLARLARWSGGTEGRIWSVGQHSVIGADAILDETGDPRAALAFLLHDAPEIVFGDIPEPSRKMLDLHVALGLRMTLGPVVAEAALRDVGGGLFLGALAAFEATLAAEFNRLVGLPKALPPAMRHTVAEMDARMAGAEIRQLRPQTKGTTPRAVYGALVDAREIRTRGALKPWREDKTIDAFMTRLTQWRVTW